MWTKNYFKQVGILSGLSFLFVLPPLFHRGLNVVTLTYSEGALRFWRGISPYLPPQLPLADQYKYSPLFAMLYRPLVFLPPVLHALVWSGINLTVFWMGIGMWVRLERRTPRLVWAGVVLASMELNGPLLYQQVNPLITGLMMIGLGSFRDARWDRASMSLALATNIKILPFMVALPCALTFKKPFLFGLGISAIALLWIPASAVGWSNNLHFHLDWFHLLLADSSNIENLDAKAVLIRHGWVSLGSPVHWLMLTSSFALLCGTMILKSGRSLPWHRWISVALTTSLLCNPRTESPTFVLLSPVYVLLALELQTYSRSFYRSFGLAVYWVAALLVTLSFNALWPKILFHSQYEWKTVGTALLWTLSMAGLLRDPLTTLVQPLAGRGFRSYQTRGSSV